jgi:hypothetical protein
MGHSSATDQQKSQKVEKGNSKAQEAAQLANTCNQKAAALVCTNVDLCWNSRSTSAR